jgi:hypothetical protein
MAKTPVVKRGTLSRREGPSVAKLGPTTATPSRRKKVPVKRDYVGIDLHRRRSVIVRMTPEGEKLSCVHLANDPIALSLEVAKAGPDPDVVIEACYGWVRHEAPCDRVGCKDPPAACRSRPLKLEAA